MDIILKSSSGSVDVDIPELVDNYNFMTLETALIPHSFYNVNSNNNSLAWKDSGGNALTSTLTPGNYNINTLATEIQTQLTSDAVAGTYTVTYSNTTYKLTFAETSGPTTFEILNTSTCFNLIGFSASQTGAASYTSTNAVDLAPTKYLIITLRNENKKIYVNDEILLYDFIIPVKSNFGELLKFPFSETPITSYTANGGHSKNFTVSIVDNNNWTPDFNGVEFVLKLNLS